MPLTTQLRLGKNATLQLLAMELPAFSGAIWDTSQWMDLHKEHVRRTNNGVEDLFSARVRTIIDKLKSSQDSQFDQAYIQSKQTPVCWWEQPTLMIIIIAIIIVIVIVQEHEQNQWGELNLIRLDERITQNDCK